MARYWVGGTGNWSSTTHWSTSSGGASGAAVPTAADDVIFDHLSGTGTATIDATAACRSLVSNQPGDATSVATLSHAAVTLSIGDGSGGSLDLSGFTSYTKTSNTISAITFVSTTTGNTVKTGGKVLGNVTFDGAGGYWTLSDALTTHSTAQIKLRTGTFDTGSQAVDTGSYAANLVNNTRELKGGTSTFTLRGTGTVFATGGTAYTQDMSAATIVVADTSATAKALGLVNINGGSLSYGTISQVNAGTGSLTLTIVGTGASVSIGTLNVSGAARTLTFTSSRTYTVTTFNVNGTAGNLITINSSTAGTAFTLSKASGGVSIDYVSLQDSTATGGAQWFAGAHSTNVSGNTGWTFTAPGWTKALTDSAAPTDSRTSMVSKALTEAPSITESVGKTIHPAQLADSVAPTDTISKASAHGLADSLALSEASAKAAGHALADSASPGDQLAKSMVAWRGESLSLADAVQDAIGISLGEALTLTEQLARGVRHGAFDSVALTDATKRRYSGAGQGQADEGSHGHSDRGSTGRADRGVTA